MQRSHLAAIALAAFAAAIAAGTTPRLARACGGGFGNGLHLDPAQKIVLKYKSAAETYIFSPHFCGSAAEFGLILPVPNKLSANPSPADKKLFVELEALTAPKIVKQPLCAGQLNYGDAGVGTSKDGGRSGVTVIDRGQVGIFDWALLKAEATKAFTDWLDANKFPYDTTKTSHFDYYVAKAWYFVAFRVTADTTAPPPGTDLCGDLGPIALSFPSAAPVIPARIAAAGDTQSYGRFGWRVFAIAAKQQRTAGGEGSPQLRFSGTVAANDLGSYPQIAKLAAAGDRVTKLDVEFYSNSITGDISLEDSPTQTDFRQTITENYYVNCDGGVVKNEQGGPIVDDHGQPIVRSRSSGCAFGGLPTRSSFVMGLGVLLVALLRLRHRRAGIR